MNTPGMFRIYFGPCCVITSMLLFIFTHLFQQRSSQKVVQTNPVSTAADQSPVLKTLKLEHPRLLASSDDFENLKRHVSSDSTLKVWYKKIKKKGDEIVDEAPSDYNLADKEHLLDISRQVVKRVYTLAILYRLNGEVKYKQRVWQELEAAASFPDWNPDHFLDVAEMTHAFAIGYDWLYADWTENQRLILKNAIIEKGLKEAIPAYTGLPSFKQKNWVKSSDNWNLVCNGGMGMGALAIADKDPKLAEFILNKALTGIPEAMKQFNPDGAWQEGPNYWDYATRYAVVFIASLESALGEDFGLEKTVGFTHTALFPVYINGPTGMTFNFADASEEAISGYQLFWFAKKYKNSAASQLRSQRINTPHALDLLWYSTSEDLKQNELPLSKYFRSAEIVSMRSSWNDMNAWYVGFKAGDNNINHSHLDLGSFVLDAFGERWVVDLGKDSYGLPGYFNSAAKLGSLTQNRWAYYRTRAEGHNTLVMNPDKKPDQDPLAKASIIKFESNSTRTFAVADLTPAYKEQASSVHRGIALTNDNVVFVQDEVQADTPLNLYWFLHTPAQIKINNNNRSAILTIGKKQLEVVIVSPATAEFQLMPAAPLPSSPQSERNSKNSGIRKLMIHLEQVKNERLVIKILKAGQKNKTSFDLPLKEW